jgi:hypothetical protein
MDTAFQTNLRAWSQRAYLLAARTCVWLLMTKERNVGVATIMARSEMETETIEVVNPIKWAQIYHTLIGLEILSTHMLD